VVHIFFKDFGRRIEAAAASVLLFIAFRFSPANNDPRLGCITFLDGVMAVTLVVNPWCCCTTCS
jgi:hypothetical protein